MNFYPLSFNYIYKEKIWGGCKLNRIFERDLPNNKIGESWELAAHNNGMSVVNNGELAGKKFIDLVNKWPEEMMGSKVDYNIGDTFPLLIKILDANDKLSVQVHPEDRYAWKREGEPGKTEMWYVIDTEPGAELIYGIKPGTTKEEFVRSIQEGNLEKYLNQVKVRKGDVFFMPAGTIHAIEEGILIAEIQQNSDTTYRVYDWNRLGQDGKPRELHIDRALEVTDFNQDLTKAKSIPLEIKKDRFIRSFLVACPFFVVEKIESWDQYQISPAGDRFHIIINLEGNGEIISKDKSYPLIPGQTYFMPARLNEVIIKGEIKFIDTYIPYNQEEIVSYLKKEGFTEGEIKTLSGMDLF